MEKIQDKLINSYKQGNFIKIISDESRNARNSLVEDISKLHNNGSIDVVEAFLKLTYDNKKYDFFSTRRIFEDALPLINAPVEFTMKCVKHLVEEAGDDGAAPFTLNAYMEYCKKDISRAKETIQIIDNHPKKWHDFLVPAIIAGTCLILSDFLKIAIKFTQHKNSVLRQRATFVLGRINYEGEKQLIKDSYKALKNAVEDEKQEDVIANTIEPLFKLYSIDNSLEEEITELITIVLSRQSQSTLFAASNLFGSQTEKLPSQLLDIIINSLKSTKANETGILYNIDCGLRRLLKLNQEETVFFLLEYLLINNPGDISIETFERITREIYQNNALLNKVITKWYLSKNIHLCRATLDIIRLSHEEDIILSVDYSQFHTNDIDTCIYIAKKAVGWLYTRPISCVSFILSILENMNSNSEEIVYLLFNPMIISYPGKLNEYFEEIRPNCSTKAKKAIETTLQHWELYLDGIKTADVLPELRPSEYHKEIYSRHFNREMAKAFKESQKDSFVHKLFSKSILLYGNKSIFYTNDSENKTHRKEFPLQNIGHSMEFPRLEKLDPHGLDYNLRIFRIEKLQL